MEKDIIGYTFDSFFLDISHKKLWKGSEQMQVSERGLLLLTYLCQASPDHISRQELIDRIWSHSVVSDASLSRLISDIRVTLDDDAKEQKIIRTTKGVGFCIVDLEPVYEAPLYASTHPSFYTKSKLALTKYRIAILGLCLAVVCVALIVEQRQQQALIDAVAKIADYQENTYTAFRAQAARRNELVDMIEVRLKIERSLQFEKFFALYFTELTQQEMFVFDQIRAITETGLKVNNQGILDELNAHPELFEQIKGARELQQHLAFWINKYHSVFSKRADMCLLYVGVEDGVPYPSGVDDEVKNWLAAQ